MPLLSRISWIVASLTVLVSCRAPHRVEVEPPANRAAPLEPTESDEPAPAVARQLEEEDDRDEATPLEWLLSSPQTELLSVLTEGNLTSSEDEYLGQVRRFRHQKAGATELCLEWTPAEDSASCETKALATSQLLCWTETEAFHQVQGAATLTPTGDDPCTGFAVRLAFVSKGGARSKAAIWDVKLPTGQKRLVSEKTLTIDSPSPDPQWAGSGKSSANLPRRLGEPSPRKGQDWMSIETIDTPAWAKRIAEHPRLRIRVVSYDPSLPAIQADISALESVLALRHGGSWHLYREGIGLAWSFVADGLEITGRPTTVQAWAESVSHGREGQSDASWALFDAVEGRLEPVTKLIRGGMLWTTDFARSGGRATHMTRVLHAVEPLGEGCVRLRRTLADVARSEAKRPAIRRLGRLRPSEIPERWDVAGTYRLENGELQLGDCPADPEEASP